MRTREANCFREMLRIQFFRPSRSSFSDDNFFIAPKSFDQEVIHKRWKVDSSAVLIELKSVLEIIEDFNSASAETIVKEWIEKKGYNLGNVMNALRLVVVGALRGPHIFDIIAWIGREETLRRIDKGIEIIGRKKE